MSDIIITERQLELITKEQTSKSVNEATGWNTAADFVGILDPTGLVDLGNAVSYFYQGDQLFGLLSLISAIPYAGDAVAKPVMGALKIGSASTKELKVALDLAKVGKTAEASASLAKLAKEPGVVGKFLQSAKDWAPKVASKVDSLPGGIFKGLKNTILDYLKLLENAGAKSAQFQKYAGSLSKAVGSVAKPAENIKALQQMLKQEKIFKNLTPRGTMSQIFLGGAPRLFGNARMRILMRQTKWWLGLLDYIGLGNFVGPEELEAQLGSDGLKKQIENYNNTDEAKRNAESDFGGAQVNNTDASSVSTNTQTTQGQPDFIQGMMQNIFGGQLKNAAFMI